MDDDAGPVLDGEWPSWARRRDLRHDARQGARCAVNSHPPAEPGSDPCRHLTFLSWLVSAAKCGQNPLANSWQWLRLTTVISEGGNVPGQVAGLVAAIFRQFVLPLMLAASLASANALGGPEGDVQGGDASTIADFFDGLRAWELNERPTAAAIWLKAAEWGDVRSMEKIGELYERGEVLPHDTNSRLFLVFASGAKGCRFGEGQCRPPPWSAAGGPPV